MGISGYDEITVEGSDFVDLSTYDHRQHCGVILDGVGDAFLLHTNREILTRSPESRPRWQISDNDVCVPICLAINDFIAEDIAVLFQ